MGGTAAGAQHGGHSNGAQGRRGVGRTGARQQAAPLAQWQGRQRGAAAAAHARTTAPWRTAAQPRGRVQAGKRIAGGAPLGGLTAASHGQVVHGLLPQAAVRANDEQACRGAAGRGEGAQTRCNAAQREDAAGVRSTCTGSRFSAMLARRPLLLAHAHSAACVPTPAAQAAKLGRCVGPCPPPARPPHRAARRPRSRPPRSALHNPWR